MANFWFLVQKSSVNFSRGEVGKIGAEARGWHSEFGFYCVPSFSGPVQNNGCLMGRDRGSKPYFTAAAKKIYTMLRKNIL